MEPELGKARGQSRGSPEEMLHKSDSNYPEGASLSLNLSCEYIHMYLFSPNKHFVSLLSVSLWEFISTKLMGQGPCHTGHWFGG